MSLQVRHSTYRGVAGFLICGTDQKQHRISIFTLTRESAERIRRKVKAGQEIGLADFKP